MRRSVVGKLARMSALASCQAWWAARGVGKQPRLRCHAPALISAAYFRLSLRICTPIGYVPRAAP